MRHLIVDGYNMLHAWPTVKKQEKLHLQVDSFFNLLAHIHDTEEIRITLVLDGKGSDLSIERPTRQTTFSILYSPAHLSADNIIESILLKSKNASKITIATQDIGIKNVVESLGAFTINAQELKAWINRSKERQSFLLKRHQKSQNRYNPWSKLEEIS